MEDINIVELREKFSNEWDSFIDRSNNGTIFHKTKFLAYHPEGRFQFKNLMFYQKEQLVAVLPGRISDGDFISPAGASYGGFVTGDINLLLSNRIVTAFKNWCFQNKIRRSKMTLPPLPYFEKMNQNVEFTLLYYGFNYQHHLFTSVINLNNFNKENILDSFESHARRNVKKALRSPELHINICNDYDGYYPILVENKKKFDLPPTHSLEEMKRIVELLPNDVKLFMCYHESKPIAGIWVMKCNSKTLLAFYIASLQEYQEHRPVNRLFYEVIKWGIDEGFHHLDLGVSMNTASDNPMEPSYSLVSFKESVSSRGFLRSTIMKVM